jgi:tetratricopeptide (TPR) repeat protein
MVYSAPKAALGPLRRAVGLAPDNMDGWLALGRALHVSGQTKEALQTLREAREVFGDSEEIKLLIIQLKQAHHRKSFFRLALKWMRRPGLTPFPKDLRRIFRKR